MGVTRTAFACFGVRVEIPNWQNIDDDELNDRLAPTRTSVVEWGSRYSGGTWGLVLCLKETYKEIDFDAGVGMRAIPDDRSWDLSDGWRRLAAARDAVGAPGSAACTTIGLSGWFVGGHIS
jgi:hypothetical protein